MSTELQITLAALAVFLAVVAVVAVMGLQFARRVRIQARLTTVPTYQSSVSGTAASTSKARVPRDAKVLGMSEDSRNKLRAELIAAGYFADEAPLVFTLIRLALLVVLPTFVYIGLPALAPDADPMALMFPVIAAVPLGFWGPEALLRRQQTALQQEYRSTFPDFLDLMTVCVDAGLGLDAALERVGPELLEKSKAFSTNMTIVGMEIRAGRSTTDALSRLAERLRLPEAQSFSMLLRQSIELGTDTSDALRTFSDEMRDKRLASAEAKAYALPVKLVLPLGVFIFPVLMIMIMAPVVIKISGSMSSF